MPDPAAVAGAIAALPDTIHATVLARLDALEPVARRAVQVGAVLGRTFEPGAIPVVDGQLEAAAVDTAVEDLLERDLVRPAAPGAVTFRHILIREVAYNTLPRAERARLHGAAGRWLIERATSSGREDELAELVAFHLREAVSLGGLVGEPLPEDLPMLAVDWLRRAAEAAAAGAATTEAARHLNSAIELAPAAVQPDLYERLGQIWSGGDQGAEAFERAWELGKQLGLGPEHELRTLAQAMTLRARWTGSVGHRLSTEEGDRRFARIEELLGSPTSDLAQLHGELSLSFRQMMNNFSDEADLRRDAFWAERALSSARKIGQADLLSAAFDAAGAVELARDEMRRELELSKERQQFEDRVSTYERADSWIVRTWAEVILGQLEDAVESADRARAGLGTGQASSFVLGASCWRIVALHALGRWDEALADATRAERAWQESELRAPWYAINGFLAALAIARGRGDPVGADHWRELIRRIDERSDEGIRTRRMLAYATEDLDALGRDVVQDFRIFAGRLDYVALALGLLADRRHPVAASALDELIGYAEARGLRLVSAAARRLRGISRSDPDDLSAALADFEAMGALPYIARLRTELGQVTGDAALVDQGMDGLEAVGDIEQSSRVAAERKSKSAAPAS
jgi:hypothetical protein